MSSIKVSVVSAEAQIYTGEAILVTAPARYGDVGIKPRHAPMLTLLSPGEVRVTTADNRSEAFYVSGGILEVQPNLVTVLSDTAVRAADLDEAQAEQAKARAQRLMHDREASIDFATAQAEFAEAVAQLHTIQRLRRRKGR